MIRARYVLNIYLLFMFNLNVNHNMFDLKRSKKKIVSEFYVVMKLL